MPRRTGRGVKVSKKALIDAIKDSGGIITDIAARLGVDRKTIYNRLQADQELVDLLEEERDHCLDIAESHIRAALIKGDLKICAWYLQCKGRDRGYAPANNSDSDINGIEPRAKVILLLPDDGRYQGPEVNEYGDKAPARKLTSTGNDSA
jgi:Bacterial regulatory protein, Fis family